MECGDEIFKAPWDVSFKTRSNKNPNLQKYKVEIVDLKRFAT